MDGAARKLTETVAPAPATEATPLAPPSAPPPMPARLTIGLVRRWLALHRGELRALAIGALSLALFLLAWHLLTKYRVTAHVRFVNVPSPEMVLDSLMRVTRDNKFLMHVYLSCRRILIGFAIAATIAVPLGLVMGRFRLVREIVFPVSEVLRPIPAIAWVPMAIMLWPTNEESIIFITFLGSFFPILLNTLHGMTMVDPVLIRAAQCLGARETAIFREVYFPATLPHVFTGLTVGMGVAWVSLIAAEMISGQFGIGYFTWEAYSLVQYADIALGMICIGVLGLGSSAHAMGQEMTAASAVPVQQGKVTVTDFDLSYDTLEGSIDAVRDASIHVDPGEFVSIIGPSGCGKSTLLNAVAGFLKPTRGGVAVDGEPVAGPSADRGMVFQQYSLFPWKTVRENVEFGLKMKGMERSKRETSARTLLGLAGLLGFENQYPDNLSGGMKQRVGIIRALATGPKVLLLDEPFGALDAQTRLIMQQILTNMWQRLKTSVLFVTHDIDEAIFLSDRVYCMTARPGTIKAEVAIPLERPRHQSMMMSSEFLALRRGLMSLIREESLKAIGGEVNDIALQGLDIDLHGRSLADVI